MKKYKILAADTGHYKSLIKDYRNDMFLTTYTEKLAELENDSEFVTIYNRDEMTGHEIQTIFN